MPNRLQHPYAQTWIACAAMAFLAGIVLPPSGAAQAATFHESWSASAVTCFARSYDKRHLSAHPLQRLTRFSLRESTLGNPVRPGFFAVSLSFKLKGDPELFQAEASCEDATGTVSCEIEADGGEFTLRADGPNLLLTIKRMEIEGPQDFSPNLGEGGDDRVVRLMPSPRAACPPD